MNERLVYMRERYLALIASTGATRGVPAPQAPAAGTFRHFETEEQRQQHLKEVEEAQRQGTPF